MYLMLATALALVVPRVAVAPLLFDVIPDGDRRPILFIRDCGLGGLPRDRACEEWQRGFKRAKRYLALSKDSVDYRGDTAVLTEMLRHTYSEVWLFSNGGDLQTGIEIGRLLRQHGVTVRVPNRARVSSLMAWPRPTQGVVCISSCTVAFMGGLFRYMDPGTTYEVHSASGVANEINQAMGEAIASGKFEMIASILHVNARKTAYQLMRHFQNTLLLLGARPTLPENDAAIERWARAYSGPPRYARDRGELARLRVASEGVGAYQDLIMRIERDAMEWAIADLRALGSRLGPRAEPALEMVETMYNVGIKGTEALTRETMLRMGYLTQELAPSPPE